MSVKVGDKVFVRAIVRGVWPDGSIVIVETRPIIRTVGEQINTLSKDVLPDHPALIPVARWLAEHGEEMLADLVSVGAHEIGDAWNAEQFGDAAYRETVKRAGLALVAALEEGTR